MWFPIALHLKLRQGQNRGTHYKPEVHVSPWEYSIYDRLAGASFRHQLISPFLGCLLWTGTCVVLKQTDRRKTSWDPSYWVSHWIRSTLDREREKLETIWSLYFWDLTSPLTHGCSEDKPFHKYLFLFNVRVCGVSHIHSTLSTMPGFTLINDCSSFSCYHSCHN